MAAEQTGQMTHKEVLQALSGLLLAMFVAMVSSTIVNNALPPIVTDLGGTQTGYTWVVVATLLTMTATTPIWGKLADLVNQKTLVQVALLIFTVGSVVAGFSQSMEMLIGARAIQGAGIGGLTALVQVVIASMVSPRERGRYAGYTGAVFAVSTVSGPLIGGVLVDTLGWRWCFFVALPIAVAASLVLQRTLKLPPRPPKDVNIDYLGATLIMAGVSLLLVWVSLGGNQFDWASTTSVALFLLGSAVVSAALWVEARVAVDPVIPLRLLRDRTTLLATLASITVGIAMFGSSVYLSQYFQLSRGLSPTEAGMMTICMVGGTLLSSIVSGRLISSRGYWKKYLIAGALLVTFGVSLLGSIGPDTYLALVGVYMGVLGVGLGFLTQNLVLAVQNNTALADMGSASALVSFVRSVGGTAGVAALGAVMAHQVSDAVTRGFVRLGLERPDGASHAVPDLKTLPAPIREVFETAYGDAAGHLFLIIIPFALMALVCVLLIKEVPLRTTVQRSDELARPLEGPDHAGSASVSGPVVAAGER